MEEQIFESILRQFIVDKRNGDKAQCKCPAHADKQASLTITKGNKCVLFHCHAGCTLDEVLDAAGINKQDTFYNNDEKQISWKVYVEGREGKKIQAVYNYVSINGNYCFTKLRLEGKKIIYGKLDNERFTYGLGRKTPRRSYNAIYGDIQAINKAITENKPIFIPEGEKDVDTLTKLGYTAFTYGGVKDWQEELATVLKGANVYILADNDKPGIEVSNKILNDVKNIVKSVKVIIPTPNIPKGDITDYFNEGYTKEDFEQLLKKTTVTTNVMDNIQDKQIEIKRITSQLVKNDVVNKYSTTDKGSGALFADIFKDKHRYNPDVKDYMFFDGKHWVKDTEGMNAKTSAKLLVDALFKYMTQIGLNDKTYYNYVCNLNRLKDRSAMLKDAQDKYCFTNNDLDKDNYLLNCQNGVLILKNDKVEFMNHDADLLLSKICNAEYNSAAKCEYWNKFLNEIMQGDTEKIKYLQKIAGLSLTGETKEETMFILYGSTTRNGKSTFVETLSHLLGDYSATMRPETLAVKQINDSRQANGDIARLKGVRFVNASEPPKRMIFDVALIKTLLGRDSITARHIHEREFEFTPVFKLVINTNYLPQVLDDTVFSSGRINVISFDKHFEPHEQDKNLKNKLRSKEEISGILNWCIEGLQLYRKEGLMPPKEVEDATEAYRQQSDKIGNFIKEMLIKSNNNVKAKDVYEVYTQWCDDNGYGCENKGNFFAELRNKQLFNSTGTVDGKTVKNIVKGYDFAFVDIEEKTPFN